MERRGTGGIWLLALAVFLAGPHLGSALASPSAATRPSPAHPGGGQVAQQAVAFALAQRGKPYRWGAEGPDAYDCSGLTFAAWRRSGMRVPRTAAAQLAGLPRVHGRLRPGDLVVYATSGPTRRHVAMVVSDDHMIEARGRGIPVRVVQLRGGYLGAVRP